MRPLVVVTQDTETELEQSRHETVAPILGAPATVSERAQKIDFLQSISVPPLIDLPNRRSILLIVVDALNASHMGVYGYHRNTTPNLDTIAREAVVFSNWTSTSSWTRPAFTTILTGVPKSVHGMELTDKKLPSKLRTMAERFKAKGYRTGAFVGNPLIQKKWGYNQGFEVFKDVSDYGDFPPATTVVKGAIDWLDTVLDTPFMGVLFLTDTHAPYEAPKESRTFSREYQDIITMPPREVTKPFSPNETEGIIAAYDDELHYADTQIGRLVDWLKSKGLYENIAVVVTGDHGEIFGDHNCYQHAYHMWQPVLRVPFIVKSPDLKKAGMVDRLAGHLDTMPTLMHLAGLTQKTDFGNSVFDVDDVSKDNKIAVSAYDARGVKRQAARLGDLKLVRYEKVSPVAFEGKGKKSKIWMENPSLQLPGPRYELFDLDADPNELNNIFTAYDDRTILEKLQRTLRSEKTGTQKHSEKSVNQLDDETLRALKAAGYID
ncbi:MAG: sulfatase [Deltaproteobacteria bacterium]|nr:sulfatase [Deltaproteobacteria bacterium]